MSKEKQVCDTCGGNGEIGYFQGESRFLLTREECPACCGFGYVLHENLEEQDHKSLIAANDQGDKQEE